MVIKLIHPTVQNTVEVSMLFYCLLFAAISSVTNFIFVQEPNADGVLHVHVLCQTYVRSDSLRRSLMGTLSKLAPFHYSQPVDLLIVKSAKCHSPKAMLMYILKCPNTVVSTSHAWLNLAAEIIHNKLNQSYIDKHEARVKEKTQLIDYNTMQDMSNAITSIMQAHKVYTLNECIRADPETMQKFLHKPGLSQVIVNCATYVQATASMWHISQYAKSTPCPFSIHAILLRQEQLPHKFDKAFYDWITKSHQKKNLFILQGPSNTGKSCFIQNLKTIMPWGEIINGASFQYEGLIDKTIGVWEEPLIGSDMAEKFKQVSEGMTTMINVKWKKPHKLPRTPILVTTNHNIWRFCTQEENMFRNRAFIFFFNFDPSNLGPGCPSCELGCQCSSTECRFRRERASSSSSNFQNSCPSGYRPGGGFDSTTNSTGGGVTDRQSLGCSSTSGAEYSLWCDSSIGTSSGASTSSACSNESGPSSGRCASAKPDYGSGWHHGPSNSSNRVCGPSTADQYVSGELRCRNGDGPSSELPEQHRYGGIGRPDYNMSGGNGGSTSGLQETGILEQCGIPGQSHLDSQQGMGRTTCTCIRVPTEQDWKNYLSWLYLNFHV